MFVNEKNAREEKIENSREPKTKYSMETKTCGIVNLRNCNGPGRAALARTAECVTRNTRVVCEGRPGMARHHAVVCGELCAGWGHARPVVERPIADLAGRLAAPQAACRTCGTPRPCCNPPVVAPDGLAPVCQPRVPRLHAPAVHKNERRRALQTERPVAPPAVVGARRARVGKAGDGGVKKWEGLSSWFTFSENHFRLAHPVSWIGQSGRPTSGCGLASG